MASLSCSVRCTPAHTAATLAATHLTATHLTATRLAASHLAYLTISRSRYSASLTRSFSWNTRVVRPRVCSSETHRPVVHSRSLTSGSEAATSMEGSCLCKAIHLKVTDDNLFGEQRRGHLCHCSNCRKVAGGLFGANLIIEEEKVEWVRGRDVVKVYEDRDTLSGKPVYRHFCPDCGVPIMSIAESVKGKVILKLGIYPKLPVPEWESFAAERQTWEKPYEGCVQFKIKSHGEKMEGSP